MAKKDFYVDIDLLGNQIKNFAIEKIDDLEAIENLPAFDGRTVYNKDDGHLYVYSVDPEDPSSGNWEIQARYEDIEKAILENPAIIDKINELIENSPSIQAKLDKIEEAGKIYGTDYERDPDTGEIIIDPETGEPVVIQKAYDVNNFIDKDSDQTIGGKKIFTNEIDFTNDVNFSDGNITFGVDEEHKATVDFTNAVVTAATQEQGDGSTKVATTAYVDTAISNLDEEKLDKITDITGNKVYGTEVITDPETGEKTVVQKAYDVDSFGKIDDVQVNGTSVVTNKIANITLGTMADEDKNDYVQTVIDNGANGKAYVWNESDGGGVRYEKGSSKVYVGVHSDNTHGEFVSMYAKDGNPDNTKRFIINSNGIYYVKGDDIDNISSNDEIATKGDILAKDSLPPRTAQTAGQFLTNDGADASWADLPEYTIVKKPEAEPNYASTYYLAKDNVQVGASINIPLDMVISDATVKTCETADDPIQGLVPGDKYIDFEIANSSKSHIYIAVKDFVVAYTGSTYIDIVSDQEGNHIVLKYNDLKDDLLDDIGLNDLKDVEITDIDDENYDPEEDENDSDRYEQILIYDKKNKKWINKNRQSAIIRDWF